MQSHLDTPGGLLDESLSAQARVCFVEFLRNPLRLGIVVDCHQHPLLETCGLAQLIQLRDGWHKHAFEKLGRHLLARIGPLYYYLHWDKCSFLDVLGDNGVAAVVHVKELLWVVSGPIELEGLAITTPRSRRQQHHIAVELIDDELLEVLERKRKKRNSNNY